jgi:hypothetical protein
LGQKRILANDRFAPHFGRPSRLGDFPIAAVLSPGQRRNCLLRIIARPKARHPRADPTNACGSFGARRYPTTKKA